jgi:hypothetical protein
MQDLPHCSSRQAGTGLGKRDTTRAQQGSGQDYPALRNSSGAGCWWLTPVILATQEADIRRIMVQRQPK